MTDYAEIPAINWSSLKLLHPGAGSPRKFHYWRGKQMPDKESYRLGRMFHCLTLEPDAFELRYQPYDKTRNGKAWDAWVEDNPGVESYKSHELTALQAAANCVRDHQVATKLLRGGRAEEVITWVLPNGMAAKGRVDYITPRMIVDLKSTREIRRKWFARDADRYLYAGQLAWYHDGATAAGLLPRDADTPWIVACTPGEPPDCAAYHLTQRALEDGRKVWQGLVATLEACERANWWPGAEPDAIDLDVNPWSNAVDDGDEDEL